jgi:hypothetical protein
LFARTDSLGPLSFQTVEVLALQTEEVLSLDSDKLKTGITGMPETAA